MMFGESFCYNTLFAIEPLKDISPPIPEKKLSTAKGHSEHVLEEDCV